MASACPELMALAATNNLFDVQQQSFPSSALNRNAMISQSNRRERFAAARSLLCRAHSKVQLSCEHSRSLPRLQITFKNCLSQNVRPEEVKRYAVQSETSENGEEELGSSPLRSSEGKKETCETSYPSSTQDIGKEILKEMGEDSGSCDGPPVSNFGKNDSPEWRSSSLDTEGNIDNIEQQWFGQESNINTEKNDSAEWRSSSLDTEGNIDNIEQQWYGQESNNNSEKHPKFNSGFNRMSLISDDLDQPGFSSRSSQSSPDKSMNLMTNSAPLSGKTFNNSGFSSFDGILDTTFSRKLPEWRSRAERGSSSNGWTSETGIEVGHSGEAVVKVADMLPQEEQDSPREFEKRDNQQGSEASCDEGSLSKDLTELKHYVREVDVQTNTSELLDEDIFEESNGRRPADYYRRANLFDRAANLFAASKEDGDKS